MTPTTTAQTIGGTWVRRTDENTSDGSQLVIFLAARTDTSPAHSTGTSGAGGYDRRCVYCWGGTNHSEDAHTLKVAAAERNWHR